MKILTLLSVMVALCLFVQGQQKPEPLYIGSYFPAITIKNVINYPTDTINISKFKDKLVILDFWNIYCTVCIRLFADEMDLQEQFKNDVQFILVTRDPEDKVRKTISKWEQQTKRKFTLPIVVGDTILRRYVRNYYQPNFAWIDYWQTLAAQTNHQYINAANIQGMLAAMKEQKRKSEEDAKADTNNTAMPE